jgi:hypothetical protein
VSDGVHFSVLMRQATLNDDGQYPRDSVLKVLQKAFKAEVAMAWW